MEFEILDKIKSPSDVKKLSDKSLPKLCNEIRECLISTVSKNGGHLASNLGTVELTVALHRVFNSPEDSIIFDVGHQSYTHKLLTGRFDNFCTLRTEGGISGFMRPQESAHDPFVTGHSSNSISAAYGIYRANILNGNNNCVVSVVGDGAFTGGLIYEGLNNVSANKGNFIVVLNDNKMSISRNVGALARYFTVIRSKSSYHSLKRRVRKGLERIPLVGKKIADTILNSKTLLKNAIYHSNIFESLGFEYYGPIDGHNISELENIFRIAKNENKAVLIHVITVKGKGYHYAEKDPKNYHGVSAFDIEEGVNKNAANSYSEVFGSTMLSIAEKDDKVCAITAAMAEGTGLSAFAKKYSSRFFDVGIAEAHAMTFSAGLASKGVKPYFAVYSSFLQRSFDQLVHDVAISSLPVKICVDRAGIVGEDGESHQGVFDTAFLSEIPSMRIFSPCYYSELKHFLEKSVDFDFPSAIRYPRGAEPIGAEKYADNSEFSVYGSGKTVIVTYGRISANALLAIEKLKDEGIECAVIKLNQIYPFSDELINTVNSFEKVYFFEEGIKSGGIAEHLSARVKDSVKKFSIYAIDDTFVPSAKVADALKSYKLDTDSIFEIIKGEN